MGRDDCSISATKVNSIPRISLNDEQKKALDILESGCNVFLSGEGGTGKSYVINEFINRNKKTKNIVVCAPTGIAADNIDGTTLSSMFNIPFTILKQGDCNYSPNEELILSDIILIDEISMCRKDTFEYVINTIHGAELEREKLYGAEIKKQIIVIGDFYQLPPVLVPKDQTKFETIWGSILEEETFAFKSPLGYECNFKAVLLHNNMRQYNNSDNTTFRDCLNLIRVGDIRGLRGINEHASFKQTDDSIYLCCNNERARLYNDKRISELPGEEKHYNAITSGQVKKSERPVPNDIILKQNMRVILLVNNSTDGYRNGSLGTVINLYSDSVYVKLDNGNYVFVYPHTWEFLDQESVYKLPIGKYTQLPIAPAYAISIHKAQGQTFDKVHIDPRCFCNGQLYVALSRVRSFNGLSLDFKIPDYALKTSPAVGKFYTRLMLNDPELKDYMKLYYLYKGKIVGPVSYQQVKEALYKDKIIDFGTPITAALSSGGDAMESYFDIWSTPQDM